MRVYKVQTQDIPLTGGSSTATLSTNYFYDHRGNLIDQSAPDKWCQFIIDIPTSIVN
jgi:hypothetical protein